jgi:hypothetical protein
MTMTTLAVPAPPVPVPVRLDHVLLRRAFLVMGVALTIFAPFTPDPIEFAVGGFVPWLILRIAGTPTLPAAVVFYLIWQWLQVYARTLVSVTDSEEMARGLYGPWVVDAYWYMLASIVALALAIRAVLGSARPPSPRQATAHLAWRPVDLFQFYLGSLLVSSGGRLLSDFIPALDQPMEPVARLKIIALLLLFGGVLSAGRGTSKPCRTPRSTCGWRTAMYPSKCAWPRRSASATCPRTMPIWDFPACWRACS